MILYTLFKQDPLRLYTWSSPDQSYRNHIDYILVQKGWRSSFIYEKTYPGADCGKKTPASGFNHEDDDKYRVEVKNKFQNIMEMGSEESIPNDIWEDVKQVVLDTAQKTIPKR